MPDDEYQHTMTPAEEQAWALKMRARAKMPEWFDPSKKQPLRTTEKLVIPPRFVTCRTHTGVHREAETCIQPRTYRGASQFELGGREYPEPQYIDRENASEEEQHQELEAIRDMAETQGQGRRLDVHVPWDDIRNAIDQPGRQSEPLSDFFDRYVPEWRKIPYHNQEAPHLELGAELSSVPIQFEAYLDPGHPEWEEIFVEFPESGGHVYNAVRYFPPGTAAFELGGREYPEPEPLENLGTTESGGAGIRASQDLTKMGYPRSRRANETYPLSDPDQWEPLEDFLDRYIQDWQSLDWQQLSTEIDALHDQFLFNVEWHNQDYNTMTTFERGAGVARPIVEIPHMLENSIVRYFPEGTAAFELDGREYPEPKHIEERDPLYIEALRELEEYPEDIRELQPGGKAAEGRRERQFEPLVDFLGRYIPDWRNLNPSELSLELNKLEQDFKFSIDVMSGDENLGYEPVEVDPRLADAVNKAARGYKDVESDTFYVVRYFPRGTAAFRAEDITSDSEADKLESTRPNIRSGRNSLDRLNKIGYDIEPASDALDDYESIERSDYDDTEDYASDREDAWNTFVDTVRELEKENEEENEEEQPSSPILSLGIGKIPTYRELNAVESVENLLGIAEAEDIDLSQIRGRSALIEAIRKAIAIRLGYRIDSLGNVYDPKSGKSVYFKSSPKRSAAFRTNREYQIPLRANAEDLQLLRRLHDSVVRWEPWERLRHSQLRAYLNNLKNLSSRYPEGANWQALDAAQEALDGDYPNEFVNATEDALSSLHQYLLPGVMLFKAQPPTQRPQETPEQRAARLAAMARQGMVLPTIGPARYKSETDKIASITGRLLASVDLPTSNLNRPTIKVNFYKLDFGHGNLEALMAISAFWETQALQNLNSSEVDDPRVILRAQFAADSAFAAAKLLSQSGCCVVVAVDDAESVIIGVTVYHLYGDRSALLSLVTTSPDNQAGFPSEYKVRGVGTTMTCLVSQDILQTGGTNRICLKPLDDAAKQFWEHRGFTTHGAQLCVIDDIERLVRACGLPECPDQGDNCIIGNAADISQFTKPEVRAKLEPAYSEFAARHEEDYAPAPKTFNRVSSREPIHQFLDREIPDWESLATADLYKEMQVLQQQGVFARLRVANLGEDAIRIGRNRYSYIEYA